MSFLRVISLTIMAGVLFDISDGLSRDKKF